MTWHLTSHLKANMEGTNYASLEEIPQHGNTKVKAVLCLPAYLTLLAGLQTITDLSAHADS